MGLLHVWWPHITAGITALVGFLFRDKVLDMIKWLVERIMPDHINALEKHEKHDDERFTDVKAYIGDVKAEVIQALGQNIGYLRHDLKTERASSEKRFEFLEKVYLDSRLDKR